MMSSPEKNKWVIGWREWVSLPELNIPAVKAKIDSGARTSALHAFDLHVYRQGDRLKVDFRIRPLPRKKNIVLRCSADVLDRRQVTDSGGHREMRYVICTPVRLGGRTWPIEITLTSRDSMKFRMLLGRTAIGDRYLINPAESFRFGRTLAKAYTNRPANRERL